MSQFYKVPQLHNNEHNPELDTLKMGDRIVYA